MKTETLNVSVPKDLAEFARQDMNVGAYGTISEYFRDLLRKRRQERINQDVKSLETAVAGAPAEEPGQNFYDRVAVIQKELRRPKKRRT